jgi:hypothetical protein
MKRIFLVLLVLVSSFNFSHAQEKKIKEALVPEAVLNGYKEKYKKVPVDAWMQLDENYIAVYEKGSSTFKATFSNDGKWIQTATKVKEDAVSGAVKKAVKESEWKDWKWSESYKVETPEYKKLFVLHMKKGKEKKVLTFDPTGKAMDIK